MTDKRSYGDSCGIARALDLVGERWALLVVRELLLGPKRFTDLRAGLVHVSADVLSQRLRELERIGALRRRKLAPPAGVQVYELTEWGQELEPVLLALGRWGSSSNLPAGAPALGVDAVVVALKTMFDPVASAGMRAAYQLRLGEHGFAITVADGEIELRRGEATAPDATIDTDPGTLAALLWHGYPLASAVDAGVLRIEGGRRVVGRFLKLFPAAEPAGPRTSGFRPH